MNEEFAETYEILLSIRFLYIPAICLLLSDAFLYSSNSISANLTKWITSVRVAWCPRSILNNLQAFKSWNSIHSLNKFVSKRVVSIWVSSHITVTPMCLFQEHVCWSVLFV